MTSRRFAALSVAFAAVALSAAPGTRAADAPADAAVPLFNGKDLSGWKAVGDKKGVWAAEDGVLVCNGGGGGWLLTEKEYGDFELTFEYRWGKEGGNSGIALRTPEKGNPAYVGMEIQLIDDDNWAKIHKFELKDFQHTGSIYDVSPAKARSNKPLGEWNAVRATCKGRQVKIEQNGVVLTDANLDDFKDKAKAHPGLERAAGHVGFQSYNFRVEFRNVAMKELK